MPSISRGAKLDPRANIDFDTHPIDRETGGALASLAAQHQKRANLRLEMASPALDGAFMALTAKREDAPALQRFVEGLIEEVSSHLTQATKITEFLGLEFQNLEPGPLTLISSAGAPELNLKSFLQCGDSSLKLLGHIVSAYSLDPGIDGVAESILQAQMGFRRPQGLCYSLTPLYDLQIVRPRWRDEGKGWMYSLTQTGKILFLDGLFSKALSKFTVPPK